MGNECCSVEGISKDAFGGDKPKFRPLQGSAGQMIAFGEVSRREAVNNYMKNISVVINETENDNLDGKSKVPANKNQYSSKVSLEKITNTIINPTYKDLSQLSLKFSQNNPFKDEEFPPQISSITDNATQFTVAKKVVWKRITEILPPNQIKVFDGKIEPGDIFQGQLGDCYFLSALSTLAEHPNLISRVFDIRDYNPLGFYSVWLNHDGVWKNIIVDDYFPCVGKKPCFSKSNGSELWVMILEKAYSKLFGNYHNIQSGLPEQAVTDLTGSPNDWMTTENEEETWKFIFTKVEDEKKNPEICYILNAGSKESQTGGIEVKDETGIISGHAYAILDAKEVNTDLGLEKIIQLRNPWGQNEWNGDWSDQSNKWTPELIQLCNVTHENDGLFWMALSDFCKKYSNLSCNYLHINNMYNSTTLDFTNRSGLAVIQLQVPVKGTKGYFQFHQKDNRNFKNLGDKYKLSHVRMLIFSGTVDEVGVFIGEANSYQSTGYIKVTLPTQGEYFAVVSVEWDCDITRELTISTYTDNEVYFHGDASFPINDHFLDDCFLQIPPKKLDEEHIYKEESSAFRYSNNSFGYFYFVYVNQSTSTTFSESVQMTSLNNLSICSPYLNPLKFDIIIKPKEKKVVKYKILPEGSGGYSYSFKFTNRFQLSQKNLIERILDTQSNKKARKVDGIEKQIFFYHFYYSDGCAFYYQNNTDQTYCEQLKLTLVNLESQDDLDTSKIIEIEVSPKSGKLLKFKEKEQSEHSSFKLSYQGQLSD